MTLNLPVFSTTHQLPLHTLGLASMPKSPATMPKECATKSIPNLHSQDPRSPLLFREWKTETTQKADPRAKALLKTRESWEAKTAASELSSQQIQSRQVGSQA